MPFYKSNLCQVLGILKGKRSGPQNEFKTLQGRQTRKLSTGVPQSKGYHCAIHSLVSDCLISLSISAAQTFLPFLGGDGGVVACVIRHSLVWKLGNCQPALWTTCCPIKTDASGMPLKIPQQSCIECLLYWILVVQVCGSVCM